MHYDKNSNLNYISVLDSKQVSILSTAAGFSPLMPVTRFSSKVRDKIEHQFPLAFTVYNKFMGGVDLYDFRCKRVAPNVNSKK